MERDDLDVIGPFLVWLGGFTIVEDPLLQWASLVAAVFVIAFVSGLYTVILAQDFLQKVDQHV